MQNKISFTGTILFICSIMVLLACEKPEHTEPGFLQLLLKRPW